MNSSTRRVPLCRPEGLAALLLALLLWGGCASLFGSQDQGAASGEETAADTTARPPVPLTVPGTSDRERPGGVRLDTVTAGRFDGGKMWTFDSPPVAYFQQEYGLQISDDWFRRARLGALRIPGCTASFVSPQGLMLTNHHCGRGHATAVSRSGENILDNGFYAETQGEERRVEDLYADQLVAIQDVTDEVQAALEAAQTDAERAEARQRITEEIQQRRTRAAGGEQRGFRTEVIALYNGGRYSAYTFKRYDDVRLVMIPELALGYFGGDADNFTYPRYALDMSFFRVYENGQPYRPESFFPLAPQGSRPGDPVFVVGNPGSTLRLETVAQLAFRRDVQDKSTLAFIESRVAALKAYAEAHPEAENTEETRNQIFGLENALKLYRGRLRALRDPVLMARRSDAEKTFVQAIEDDPAFRTEYTGLVDSMAALQQEKRTFAEGFGAFAGLQGSYASATLRRALAARAYLQRQQSGAPEAQLAPLREQLQGVPSQPDDLDARFLAARLRDFQEYFGPQSEIASAALEGRSPQEAARQVVQGSVLADSAAAVEALQAGTLSMDDPAMQLAGTFADEYQRYQSATAGLSERQQDVASRLGRARYAISGTDVPPDATFSLRIADGRVEGYDYNGTYAPPFTTFYGLYGHYYSASGGADTPWDLPQRWLNAAAQIDRTTPVNMVSTNDITGGNSGSPLLNADLQVVGLIFDGNIESLAGDFIYRPERARAVSVDARGMLEALRSVYDAERLVEEVAAEQPATSEATGP